MDEIKEKIKQIKKIKFLVLFGVIAFAFLLLMAIIFEVTNGKFNIIQSVDENAFSGYKGTSGNSDIFSTLCKNCNVDSAELNKEGVMGSEFYEKTSEMMNLYNNLEFEKERDDEFDFALLSMTVQYQKHLEPELFSDATKFGSSIEEKKLTNRDINNFPNIFEIDSDNAQVYFKWASVMLGTPYSLPDIDLRGLTGNLVTGRVTTTCTGGSSKNKDQQEEDLIKQIIEVEKKFSGETVKQDTGFWNSILTFLGLSYKSDDTLLHDRLKAMLNGDARYNDLKPYVNLDNFSYDKCGSGSAVHTYTKFMNYEQYKVYLRTVFVPQNYINCEECVFKNAADDVKAAKVEQIISDIFQSAEDYRRYANMGKFDYDNITYGEEIGSEALSQMSSPIKSKCYVTSPYGYRAGMMHAAVDTIINSSGDPSLYAIADGVVDRINYYSTENLWAATNGKCMFNTDDYKNNGIEIVIKYEINGETYYSRFAHLSPNGIEVKAGDKVTKGQKVANMGNTGCSSGTHLHFDLFKGAFNSNNVINPTIILRDCENSGISGALKVSTTNNFVTPEKCMIGDYTLDETITSIIKNMDNTLSEQKEAVKATAIVIRTAIMNDSNWCNNKNKMNFKVGIDIENNTYDLNLYNQVIETQGMVLNYSGETINNAKYTTFPCEQLPLNDWMNYQDIVFAKIPRYVDKNGNLDVEKIDNAIEEYNEQCVSYNRSDPARVRLSTVTGSVWKTLKNDADKGKTDITNNVWNTLKGTDGMVEFTIPRIWITKTEKAKDIGERFASTAAKYLASLGNDYTEILYRFYLSKAINQQDLTVAHGVVDISTAPGLIDAKKLVSEKLGNNTEGFTYGTTLSGSNMISQASKEEIPQINNDLNNYITNATNTATTIGANITKAKIAASAYWLVNNNYYKVQYGASDLSQYDVSGWNPNWDDTIGVDSLGFVLWSLKQAGSSNSVLQIPRISSDKFTVEELINSGVEVGDIISRESITEDGNKISNSHYAIITEVTSSYIKVAHAVNEQVDLTITTYYLGEEFNYQKLY